MRKVPLFLGVFVLLFPLNWTRLYVLGQVPAGTDPRLLVTLTIILLIIAALLIWFGLPAVRQSCHSR